MGNVVMADSFIVFKLTIPPWFLAFFDTVVVFYSVLTCFRRYINAIYFMFILHLPTSSVFFFPR